MDNNKKDILLDGGMGYFSKPIAHEYEFYLSGDIEAPEEYVDWFNVIRNAGPNDSIKIYINSGGGVIDTALQFMRVMAETQATITCSVEGSCASAATMIFLTGHVLEVTPHSIFMFHNYSGGSFGKGGEMIDQLSFEREWSKRLLHKVYDGFFSDAEIESMLHNRDIWMHADEVLERADKCMKYRAALAKLEQGAED